MGSMLWDELVGMSPGLASVIGVSCKAGLLILAVLLVQWLGRKWLTPGWRYAMWLLVLARLAVPGLPESRTSVYNLFAPETKSGAVEAITADSKPFAQGVVADGADAVQKKHVRVEDPDMKMQSVAHGFAVVVCAIWGLGMWSLVLWTAWVCLRFKWRMRRGRRGRRVTDGRVLEQLDACRTLMRVRRRVAVIEVDGLGSPALFGVVRPALLLPEGFAEGITDEALRAVLLHELAHLKRRDVLVNWIMTFIQILHWFNPLVWVAFARMRAERELACDAWILRRMGRDEAIEYGRTLLGLLERKARRERFAGLAAMVGILERTGGIRERLAQIASGPVRPYRVATLGSLALVALLGCVSLSNARVKSLPMDFKVKMPTRPAPEVKMPLPENGLWGLPEARLLVHAILYSREHGPEQVATFVVDWPADKGRELKAQMGKTKVGVTLNTVAASALPSDLGIRLTRTPYLMIEGNYIIQFSGVGGGGSGTGGFTFYDRQWSGGTSVVNNRTLAVIAMPVTKDDPLGKQPFGQVIKEWWSGCLEQELSAIVHDARSLAPWNEIAGVPLAMPNRNLYEADWSRKLGELGWEQAGRAELTGEVLIDLDSGKRLKAAKVKDGEWPAEFDAKWDETLKGWWIRPDAKIQALEVEASASCDVFGNLAKANAALGRLDTEGRPDEAGRVMRSPVDGKKNALLIRTDTGSVMCALRCGYGTSGGPLGGKAWSYFNWYRYKAAAKAKP